MLDRRQALIGLGCAAALGTAELLRPRHPLAFMPAGKKLVDLVPRVFPGFHEGGAGDIVVPRTEGSLVATLYSDLLTRFYEPVGRNDISIMLLIAYGPAQTDLLQLHRPEICYPAAGYEIVDRTMTEVPVARGAPIPAVNLTASQNDRLEDITYWTRVGTELPRSRGEQSWSRLHASIKGDIPDGTLLRASVVRNGPAPGFDMIRGFLGALVAALPQSTERVLVGR